MEKEYIFETHYDIKSNKYIKNTATKLTNPFKTSITKEDKTSELFSNLEKVLLEENNEVKND